MKRTKKSAYYCLAYRALEIKSSGILPKLVERCENQGVTPEIAKVFGTLDYFIDQYKLEDFSKYPKSWTIARYDELLEELNQAYEKAQLILVDKLDKQPTF